MVRKKQAVKIMENLWYFAEFPNLDCSMYMLKNREGEIMVIDAGNGMSLDPTLAAMDDLGLKSQNIKKILITHEHLDHVLGLYPLLKMLPTPPEIIAHPITARILEEGDEYKICPRELGISPDYFGVNIVPLKVTPINIGDVISFGEFRFQTIETLGHSLGSVTYYEPGQKLLFPGDVVFPQGSFGRYDFPGGDLEVLRASIKRLAELDVSVLCAGHMNFVNNANKHIAASLRNIQSMQW
jgi:glyoxylase-like metal-dependent hydrolase (beta-lactamase superfamily II)